jgi:flagellar hook assembly protein FlgD
MWNRVYVCDIDLGKYATVTSVKTEKPLEFALQGNYPNPFNPSTTIRFSLANAGKVNLAIYNIAGQKIRQLVSETMQPGSHAVRWDGRNDKGQTVSSGTYIMRLSTGSSIVTKNMMLLK